MDIKCKVCNVILKDYNRLKSRRRICKDCYSERQRLYYRKRQIEKKKKTCARKNIIPILKIDMDKIDLTVSFEN